VSSICILKKKLVDQRHNNSQVHWFDDKKISASSFLSLNAFCNLSQTIASILRKQKKTTTKPFAKSALKNTETSTQISFSNKDAVPSITTPELNVLLGDSLHNETMDKKILVKQ
jgi:hypothetical protein